MLNVKSSFRVLQRKENETDLKNFSPVQNVLNVLNPIIYCMPFKDIFKIIDIESMHAMICSKSLTLKVLWYNNSTNSVFR